MGRTAVCLLLGLVLGTGCDENKTPPTPVPTASVALPAAPSASAAAPAASDTPVDPSAAAKWVGTYESKTVKLETPEKVKDVTWTQDDGTKALGKGQMTMQVKDGLVTGEATGPLGPQKLSGMIDDKTLRLSLLPEDPTSSLAMSGSGLGVVANGAMSGSMRCADPKGVVVREVSFELKPATK